VLFTHSPRRRGDLIRASLTSKLPFHAMRFLNGIVRDLFALLAGFFYTLAFAPFDFSVLAVLALMLLFASWQHANPLKAALRGYLFGLASFGLGIPWVYVSVHEFGFVPPLEAAGITALCVAFWALFPAVAGWLAVKTHGNKGVVMVPLLWVLIEYGRGYLLLNGFPWLLAAYSQLETPLAGYIPILGAYGTGFLLALTASLAAYFLRDKTNRPMTASVAIGIWLLGWGLQQVVWTRPIGKPIHTVMIQGNISQDKKWLPENRVETLRLYKNMTEQNWGADVIVWPETAIPAYLSQVDEHFLQPLRQLALLHGSDLVVSLPAEGEREGEIYNAVITLGKTQGMYKKNHLLPFGEYMPLQPFSGWVLKNLHIVMGDFTPGGDRQPLLRAGGYPFITTICYEAAFGDAGLHGLPEAAYLVNVTNDAWFGDSSEPHQHLQIARMRSLETGRYMLRSTNTGITAVIGPDGKVRATAPAFTTTALAADITPMGGMTAYAHWGDKPVVGLMLMVFLGLYGHDQYGRWRAHQARGPFGGAKV